MCLATIWTLTKLLYARRRGAGTGKTLLMTKKISSMASEQKILVVARLPRLISAIKSAVENERDASNVAFTTYEELLGRLSRSVKPSNDSDCRNFSAFSQVTFGGATVLGPSVNFVEVFLYGYLTPKERKLLEQAQVEPMTLWTAFRAIKSRASCAATKKPICRTEYMALPASFRLGDKQREIVYDMYLRYEAWLSDGIFKWDEADRVQYILKWGPSVFSDSSFCSWAKRAYSMGEVQLLAADGNTPLSPFFYDRVFVDEAQDLTELDLALLLRMSGGLRSLFLGSDPAQSVEQGIRMRAGTVNDVFFSALAGRNGIQVKHVLQDIEMKTNHRTHARNLALAKAARKVLARSFGVPESKENAMINGQIPRALSLKKLSDLANEAIFCGGNVVFLVPDETKDRVKSEMQALGVHNDVFGVREAKGQ